MDRGSRIAFVSTLFAFCVSVDLHDEIHVVSLAQHGKLSDCLGWKSSLKCVIMRWIDDLLNNVKISNANRPSQTC